MLFLINAGRTHKVRIEAQAGMWGGAKRVEDIRKNGGIELEPSGDSLRFEIELKAGDFALFRWQP